MAKFCGKCGTQLPEASGFCPSCGAPAATPAPAVVPPVQGPPAAQVAKSSNTLIKVVLVIVMILGIGAIAVVGGLWYVGHKMVSKVETAAAQAGISTADLGKQSTTNLGDPCRFLSKEDVGDAIGVPITETQSTPDGCSYLAHGSMSEMTAKHMAAIVGQRGAPADTQKEVQQMAGGFFQAQQKPGEDSDTAGNAVVLAVSFQTNSARTQMKLDSTVLGAFGQAGGSSTLTGIGDEASVAADAMMMVRKGDTMVRFLYTSCPCSTQAIKPLAKKVADQL
jgi:hypothetical protein